MPDDDEGNLGRRDAWGNFRRAFEQQSGHGRMNTHRVTITDGATTRMSDRTL